MERGNYLVETSWLADHLHDEQVRIVDMRGYVKTVIRDGVQDAQYVGAREDYEQGHIPGAVYIDWSSDIIDPNDAVEAQVAPPARFKQAMEQVGIGDQHLVVAYDAHPASQFATRLWWALRYYGHERVVVLNGGLPKWLRDGYTLDNATLSYPPATFTPSARPELRATAQDVLASINQAHTLIVDAREPGQYNGTLIRGHGRPGHIPGAINIPREELIDPNDGTFRNSAALQQIFSAAGVTPQEHVIAYCNGGVAATTILFTLAMLGYPQLTNYDGSWNEWGKRADLPTEV